MTANTVARKEKGVRFSISAPTNFLEEQGLTFEQIRDEMQFLFDVFGNRFTRFFPLHVKRRHINRMMYVAGILRGIRECAGFDRFISRFSKSNFDDHLFSARCAYYFAAAGYDIELEPKMQDANGDPDLKISKQNEIVYVECKRIRVEKYYELDRKLELVEQLYSRVNTCDQINVELFSDYGYGLLTELLQEDRFVSEIYELGLQYTEYGHSEDDAFELRLLRRPPIIGGEEDFLDVTVTGVKVSVETGARRPDLTLMRGGRSVSVTGPPVNYRSEWNQKRRRSKRQAVAGAPFMVAFCGDDVLGDPENHRRYFEDEWLVADNREFSGIALVSFATLSNQVEAQYYLHPQPNTPIPDGFFVP
tara:strand:- start:135 stop:1220 length:1086 start_codon:yes stop_codon:yes gene_type:complete